MSAMESRLTAHVTGVEQRLGERLDAVEAQLARLEPAREPPPPDDDS